MKRLGLFIVTHLAIMLILGIVLNLLGIDSLLAENNVDLDLKALLVFSVVIGMTGSFISLAISKWSAVKKWWPLCNAYSPFINPQRCLIRWQHLVSMAAWPKDSKSCS